MRPERPRRIVGVLEAAAPDPQRLALWAVFRRCLGELGHTEGADLALEFRWACGRTENLASAATELVALDIDVLVTAGTPAAAAASRATSAIPIVMATGVGLGTEFATRNITGISDLPPGISARRLELLRDAVSPGAPLAFLADRGNPSSPLAWRETMVAARALGIAVADHWIESADQFGAALATMKDNHAAGFVTAPGALFFAQRHALAALALDHRLASMAVRREYVEAGCLMGYGAPIHDNYRQAADYVSRILHGATPAELPIAEPAAFDFVVNLKTAAAFGLTLPHALLAGAETIGQ